MKKTLIFSLLYFLCSPIFAQDFMMQGWYWDYPKTAAGASWADTLRLKSPELGQAGFTMLWLPPLSRTASGSWSNGYDPKDLFDYGEFGQGATGFGTRTAVDQLITAMNGQSIKPVADVVYNHRDGGSIEDNPGLKTYTTTYYDWNKANDGANPFPYDRMRVVLPLGGSSGNGAGDYYFKFRSRSQHTKFYNYEYKVYFYTDKVGWQNLSDINELEPNGGGDCGQGNNTIGLGRNINGTIESTACGIDEFKLTLTAADFNAGGDALYITFNNRTSGYSDLYLHGIWSAPRSADIVNDLYYQTYTNYNYVPSGRGKMNWSFFKPNLDRATYLTGDWDGMYFYYDYDQFQSSTRDSLFAWTRWNWSNVGIRGFRMDAIKHFTPQFIGDMLDNLHDNNMDPPMVVGEWYGTNTDELSGWVNSVYSYMDNDTKLAIAPRIFDFSLREALRQACDQYGYDVRSVFGSSIVDQGKLAGLNVVTFANNHDFRDGSGFASLIQNDRMLAYTYLLTNNQIGVPTVFYPDYFGYPASGPSYYPSDKSDKKYQVNQLLDIHKKYIFGSSSRTYLNNYSSGFSNNASANNTLLVYQLKGGTGFKNLLVAINFSGSATSFNQQLDGIAVGTKLSELTGNSSTSVTTVEASAGGISNSVWIQIPARSYSIFRVGAWSLFTTGRSNIGFNLKGTPSSYTVWNNVTGTIQNADLGTFVGSDVLSLTSYDIRSWKASGGDVTGGTFYYTIYPKGERPTSPVFQSQAITWQENIGGSGTEDQRWGFTGALNILAGLSSGEYTLEFYSKMNGTDPIKSEYDNNGGNASNYTAHFRYKYVRSAAAGTWDNSATWLDAVIPASSDVTAEIGHNVGLSDSRSIHDLLIEAGSLTINPSGSLTVNGNITAASSKSLIVLESDADHTASLIHETTGIEAVAKRYIGAWTSNDHGWHFLSSPVNHFPLAGSSFVVNPVEDYDFFSWSEPDNQWLNQKLPGNGITEFVAGKGYLVSYKTGSTKEFSGALSVADVPVSNLTYTPASTARGWHLLGNPFSSAINWTSGTWNKSVSIGGEPQIWDEADASYKTLTNGIIPPHNGFMVYTSEDGGSLVIPADAREHATDNWLKSENGNSGQIILTARDLEGNTAQQTIIRFMPEATADFDLEYDSFFLAGYAPWFYSVSGEHQLTLNSLPNDQEMNDIHLGFIKNEQSEFRIEASQLPDNQNILLVDRQLNHVQNLSQNPVYQFVSSEGDDADRFMLKFSETGIEQSDKEPVIVFSENQNIYVMSTEQSIGNSVEIYDINGRLLVSRSIQTTNPVFLAPAKGVLIIKVKNENETQVHKILIH